MFLITLYCFFSFFLFLKNEKNHHFFHFSTIILTFSHALKQISNSSEFEISQEYKLDVPRQITLNQKLMTIKLTKQALTYSGEKRRVREIYSQYFNDVYVDQNQLQFMKNCYFYVSHFLIRPQIIEEKILRIFSILPEKYFALKCSETILFNFTFTQLPKTDKTSHSVFFFLGGNL